MGEAIADIPGVDVTMNKLGTYNFTIRGFGNAYTLILIDGKRQSVANGFFDNGFDGSETGYLPPLSMIERIEVIRGPASTLYGTDAVGGVINIITKKNPNETQASLQFDTLLQEHQDLYGNAGNINAWVATPLIEDKLSISARLKYYNKASSGHLWPTPIYQTDRATGTDSEITNGQIPSHSPGNFTSLGFGARLNYTLDDANNFYFDAERYINDIHTRSTSSARTESKRTIFKDNFVLNHDGSYGFGTTSSYLQYSSTRDPESYHSEIWVGEGKTILPYDLNNFGNLALSLGARVDYELLRNKSSGALDDRLDQTTAAAYGEGEYFITDDLIFTAGLRYVYSDLFSSELTPRAYVVYHLLDNVTLKGGVAKGYKTPAAKHLTAGAFSVATASAQFGNPDLKPETSINYELGVDFNLFDNALNYTITGFITDFKNQISTEGISGTFDGILCDDGSGSGITCTQRINLNETQTKGVEFGFNTAKFKGFSFDSTYTFMDNRYKDGRTNVIGTDRITNLPRHIAMARINYEKGLWSGYLKFRGRFDTIAQSKGGGNRPLTNEFGAVMEKYKPFYVFDLGASYKVDKKSSIHFAINNLFDKDFFDPLLTGVTANGNPSGYANRYQDYTEGRSFWLSYKYDF